ncbi:MAG: hypothetical protein Q8R53_00715 [Nanoarchaeota archaeon]|nr:hypothetical protein [Nanoarchaeota archaeon]
MSTKTLTKSGLEEILGKYLPLAQRYFENQFIEEQAEFLLALAERCGAGTGRAYDALPKELVSEQADFLLAVAERCGTGTGRAYDALPRELVSEHAEFLLTIAEHCGKRTGAVYEYFLRDLTSKSAERVFQRGREQGITHFDRYFMNHNFPLEECTLEAIAKASPEKPLAVIIHNKNDKTEAFSNARYITELLRVLDHYSVCLFETDNRTEAFRDIERAATAGKKKISLLILGGHGDPYSLNLGETAAPDDENDEMKHLEREQERYLSALDGARFAEMEKYISPDGKIVLVSCSTGAKIANGKNLAEVISEAIPHATVYAPQEDTHLDTFVFQGGELADVVFYWDGLTRTVKLRGGSYEPQEE